MSHWKWENADLNCYHLALRTHSSEMFGCSDWNPWYPSRHIGVLLASAEPNFVTSAAKLNYGPGYRCAFASMAEPPEPPIASPETTNSIRRFCCRPAAVSLVATGWLLPNPRETMEDVTMPCLARKSRTEFARFSDKRMLSSSVPTLSVWPSTPSVRVGYAPSVEQRAERIHRLVDS